MVPGAAVIKNDSVSGTAVLVQKGVCQVVAMHAINNATGVAFVQYFDAAAAGDVTVGTTVPVWVISSPTGPSVSLGDGLPTHGLIFKLGVVIASTTDATGLTGKTQHVRTAVL